MHLPSLRTTLKQKLLSASAKALKICWKNLDIYVSFESLLIMSKRATPEQLLRYKLTFMPPQTIQLQLQPQGINSTACKSNLDLKTGILHHQQK